MEMFVPLLDRHCSPSGFLCVGSLVITFLITPEELRHRSAVWPHDIIALDLHYNRLIWD